jgi:hypothetical protein
VIAWSGSTAHDAVVDPAVRIGSDDPVWRDRHYIEVALVAGQAPEARVVGTVDLAHVLRLPHLVLDISPRDSLVRAGCQPQPSTCWAADGAPPAVWWLPATSALVTT